MAFRAKFGRLFKKTYFSQGQVQIEYVFLAKSIVEASTGAPFRDHCYIAVSKSIFEKMRCLGSCCCFTGEIYRYSKLVHEGGYDYRRFQLGLKNIKKVKAK